MTDAQGYWLPHTSSVDFCEPNYYLTTHIAEPHNVWSSFYMVLLGVIGAIWANPLNEWRALIQHGALCVVGLGSMALHGTLGAIWQSADEVPMLWQNIIAFYVLAELASPRGMNRSPYLPSILFSGGVTQTVLYYTMQSFYAAFLTSFVLSVGVVLAWTHILATEADVRPEARALRRRLWAAVVISFLVVATPLWVFEMNFCDSLMPYILSTGLGGATLHIIWHIGAGTSSYLGTVLLTVIRIQKLGQRAELRFICGMLPIPVIVGEEKRS